jgi:glycosyltransferase involved in cell wall biosynthesis
MKKITIITATYNAGAVLENLIQSIVPQKKETIEFIIIDGNSKDNTLDIVRKYESNIDFWISEPDKGIYDAWNKGIKVANGDWIMFIGADDELLPNSLSIYINYLKQNLNSNELDLLSSKRKMIDQQGKEIRIVGEKWIWPQCLKGMMISHPGAMHNKRLFNTYGIYDISYRIAGDYELLLRAKDMIKADFIDEITIVVSEGGISDSFAAIKEHYRAVTQHQPGSKLSLFLIDSITTLKYFTKSFLRKFGLNIHLK